MPKFINALSVPKKRVATYNLNQDQIEQIKQEARREGLRAGVYAANAMYSVSLLLVLRDKLGFGKIRLTRIFKAVQKFFEEVAADDVAYKDAAQTLEDECGICLMIERPGSTPVNALSMFRQMEVAKSGYKVKLR